MLHFLKMLFVGLLIGALARWFYPGAVHMGWIASALLGIAGSYVAGYIGQALHPSLRESPLHPAGFVYSIVGSMLLIFVARSVHLF